MYTFVRTHVCSTPGRPVKTRGRRAAGPCASSGPAPSPLFVVSCRHGGVCVCVSIDMTHTHSLSHTHSLPHTHTCSIPPPPTHKLSHVSPKQQKAQQDAARRTDAQGREGHAVLVLVGGRVAARGPDVQLRLLLLQLVWALGFGRGRSRRRWVVRRGVVGAVSQGGVGICGDRETDIQTKRQRERDRGRRTHGGV